MKTTAIYQIPSLSILDFDGQDTAAILHNLTTNDVKALASGSAEEHLFTASGCETFITDVRGKTLGHVNAYRTATGMRLIGASGQSEVIASHADKYIIREDAVPTVRDTDFSAFAIDKDAFQILQNQIAVPKMAADDDTILQCIVDSDNEVSFYENSYLGDRSVLMLVPKNATSQWIAKIASASLEIADDQAFHVARTINGFPWYGIDLSDKNLPQEADRDARAISFTKGCYLGQETVARLDALGQVQKKLVRWLIDANPVEAGTELTADGKLVGRLTSVAPAAYAPVGENQSMAIGMARRSHFDVGSTATGTIDGQSFTATVL